MVSNIPLGTDDKLGDPNFGIPLQIIYGENDWMGKAEQYFG